MSRQNVEIVRSAYEQFRSSGEFRGEFVAPEIVWDMSHYPGWVERARYEGVDGGHQLISDWTDVWDLWQFELDGIIDAGEDKVIVILIQRSQSLLTKVPVTICIAQVWTMRDGKGVRLDAYATPGDALRACGLAQ